jgi:hypothetical protein
MADDWIVPGQTQQPPKGVGGIPVPTAVWLKQHGAQPAQQNEVAPAAKAPVGDWITPQVEQKADPVEYDTKSGAPIALRVALQRASNPDEAKLLLDKQYGGGNYGQNQHGEWWVRQNGKPTMVLPEGVSGAFQNLGTGMISSGWPMAGAIGGGAIGGLFGEGVGAIPGAMAGAAAGKGIEDMIKWAQGLFAQKPAEAVTGIANEAALSGAFQMIPGAVQGVKTGVQSALQKFTGVTPATRAMAQDLSAGGAKPPIGSFAPEAKATEYKRQLRNMVAGNPAESANVDYIAQRMDGILAQEGVPPPERQTLIKEAYDTSARTSAREAGEKVVEAARGTRAALLNEAQSTRRQVEQAFNQADRGLRQMALAPVSTAQDVAGAVRTARKNFSVQMAGIYEKIDNLTGDQKIVPTQVIKEQAKELVKLMPPNALPPLIKQWASGQAPKTISFAQAHALRSTLREMGEMLDVSPTGQRIGNIRKLAAAVDEAIASTEDFVGQQAAQQLKAADQLYAQGIAKFNNTAINRVVRELRSGIVPEPGYVANLIMNPDNPNLARTVFAMLPEQTRNNVIKADMGNLIAAASSRDAQGALRMDGQSLMKALDARKPVMDAVYPPQMNAMLRRYATDLAAFDGKIDVTNIKTPTAVMNLLERAVGAARAADEFVRTNPLGALAGGTPMQVDRALARLTMPGNEAMTAQAAQTLGVDSPAWRAVRKYALQRLFAGSAVETQSLSKTISGPQIDKALSRYTKKQQDLLFPNGLADDLKVLAQESKFLFPGMSPDKEFGTSLAAANIKQGLWLHPWAVYKYIRASIGGWIADHPRVLHYLTDEIRRDRNYGRSLTSVMMQWITERALNGPGGGQPTMPVPPMMPPVRKTQDRQPAYAGNME